jgi:hypothetical protein
MADLLAQGAAWLGEQRGKHMASTVTYRRGATEADLSATFGRTRYEVEDEYGVRVGAEVTDFLVAAADFAPAFGEPEAGDEIVVHSTGSGQAQGVVFEVMAWAGQGHWRWSDPHRTTLRIHAKQTGTQI